MSVVSPRAKSTSKVQAASRVRANLLAWAANVRWRDGLAIAFTAGALAAATVAVVDALGDHDNRTVILAAIAGLLAVAGQAAIRREMLKRVAESRRYWFSSSPRGLAEMDADLRFVAGNSRLASLLVVDEAELPGTRLTAFFDDHDVNGIASQFALLLNGAVSTIDSDDLAIRRDQTRVWLHWRATEVRRRNGSFEHFVITFEDSTQKHVAEEAAHANLAELEGMSELINAGNIDPADVHEYSGYIFQEAERINRLITDMLDLDRLEAGKMKLVLAPMDLNATVEGVAARSSVVSPRHDIRTDLEAGLPKVMGDSDRLVQVITNLVSNAIKYSPDGGEILISTHLTNGLVDVSIADHGVGIPADFAERLFGRFERYEKTPSKIMGTGLGLAIARQILEMHNGKIWVVSTEGKGSVFHFTIPAIRTVEPGLKIATPKERAAAAAAAAA